ncbi:MAG TPA: transcription-repair coupling factor [Chloroflexia bacterium]|nr:transcription-repair coupling factor [Chloroflexia bacterium]
MSLSGLLPLLYDQPEYIDIARRVASGENTLTEPVQDAARAYMLAALHADVAAPRGRPVIVVAPRSHRARQLYEGLVAYSPPGTPILFFPAPDLLPYERIAPDPTIVGERLRVLASLTTKDEGRRTEDEGSSNSALRTPHSAIIVTSVFALMHPTMSPDDMAHAMQMVRVGERVNLRGLLEHLVDLGYESVAQVDAAGQFSRRGGIVDFYPPTSSLPIRIDFFGDEVDSIRLFNPLTQRSEGQAGAVLITPSCEMPLWKREQAAAQIREIETSNLREEVLEEWQSQLRSIEAGECFEGMELFAPYYTQPLTSLADYLARLTTDDDSEGRRQKPEGRDQDIEIRNPKSEIRNLPPLLVLDDPELIRLEAQEVERQASELYAGFVANGELPPGMKRPYLTWEEVSQHGRGLPVLSIGGTDAGSNGRAPLPTPQFTPPRLYSGNIPNLISDLKERIASRSRIVIVSQQSGRLRELFEDEDIYPTVRKGSVASDDGATPKIQNPLVGVDAMDLTTLASGLAESLGSVPSPGSVHLLHGGLAAGWLLDDSSNNLTHHASRITHHPLTLLTDAEIFGRSQTARRTPGPGRSAKSSADAAAILREKMLLELKPDDYVVHVEHGIAKYGGLVHMEREGTRREYMLLLYAAGDRLYVPADQTDRVAPYIGVGPPPALHRLGTADWTRTKKRVRESAELLAKELLQLYAARETAPGHAYQPDTPWQHELEESFPYIETPDQLRAIADVKGDMEQPRPMDRLVCGDVGYGKTEVALRAAFKAVMDGRQVAVLVPTTVLAQQHYNTFSERLSAFPVSVSMLSRFRSKQEQTQIVKELEEGRVDILVGTHMLLSKSVRFKDLGLVIVDEEQRFGVRHKERLKQLRAEVDVITLSATPIPRTLYMAISGVRDLSLIETPPEARLPIKTYVTAFRPQLVREVILRELERGGQVFFVHNRVETIEKLCQELRALVPEARFIVGHGQMPEDHLEKVMQKFVGGEADVLLCTTIIESGLDIPNANTLIVDHADKLGLAQLYQLRGRVGRGTNRAYSYFLYHAGRKVTETARERLSTIEQATELGAGFRIALKDLEIRGAGNLLGPEQSGQVASVGLDLYTRLLAAAVDRARVERRDGRKTKDEGRSPDTEDIPHSALRTPQSEGEPPSVSLDLPITAYLPEEYVPDAAVRLRVYQRMAASMTPGQVRDMARELEDRFGALPEPVTNLLEVVRLKGLAIMAGVESIRALAEEILVVVPEERAIPEHLRMRIQRKYRDQLKVTPHQVRIIRSKVGIRWKDVLSQVLEELGEAE